MEMADMAAVKFFFFDRFGLGRRLRGDLFDFGRGSCSGGGLFLF